MIRISDISFFCFCWKNGKLDWPECARTNNASKAVSERLLKLHGRWKTDEAKDMYVLETECNRLSVTKYLGI